MFWLPRIGWAVLLFLIQLSLGGILTIGGAKPDLLLPFVIYQGLRYGAVAGTITGALCGLALDMMGSGPIGVTMFALTIVGFVVGKIWQEGPFRLHWPWATMLLAGGLFEQVIVFYFHSRDVGLPFGELFFRYGIASAFYTTVLGVIWFLSPLYKSK